MKKLLVISCYNEESNILRTLSTLPKGDFDIVVIDNSSTDKTVELAESKSFSVIRHPVNSGGSQGVIKTAFLYAFLEGYDIYCHMDGDDQHDPKYLNALVEPVLSGEADVVIGSRFLADSAEDGFKSLPVRRIGIRFFSWLNSKISGQKVTDLTSGFRAYNRKAITFFARQFKHEFDAVNQLFLVMAFNELVVKEVPVSMKPRVSGKSEINLYKSFAFPVKSIISIIGTLLQVDFSRRKK